MRPLRRHRAVRSRRPRDRPRDSPTPTPSKPPTPRAKSPLVEAAEPRAVGSSMGGVGGGGSRGLVVPAKEYPNAARARAHRRRRHVWRRSIEWARPSQATTRARGGRGPTGAARAAARGVWLGIPS